MKFQVVKLNDEDYCNVKTNGKYIFKPHRNIKNTWNTKIDYFIEYTQ